jgi:hypothetical protein
MEPPDVTNLHIQGFACGFVNSSIPALHHHGVNHLDNFVNDDPPVLPLSSRLHEKVLGDRITSDPGFSTRLIRVPFRKTEFDIRIERR